jgi:hypothetical protein
VYVAAAEVGEAVACVIDLGRAVRSVGVVYDNGARRNRDQAGTRMGVPSAVSSRGERVLHDIDIRISLNFRLEVLSVQGGLFAHQVERAKGKMFRRQD